MIVSPLDTNKELTDSSDAPRLPRYDLHSHTQASDGLFTPQQLVERAVEMQVNVLAITDHDTTAGLAEAHRVIVEQALPLTLINGVEISTNWQSFDIHIVGLNLDITHPQLTELLSLQKQRRQTRAEEIARRLEKNRIPNPLEGARRLANGAELTRAHFARYMVEIGIAPNLTKIFNKYLSKGRVGYVPPQWCSMAEAIAAIQAAGGKAVLAHPDHYDLSAKWLRRLIVDFKQANGDGIEVAHCQQAPDRRTQLGRYAQEYQLLASQGSDFHQPCIWLELGKNLWLPKDCTPVWSDW